MIFQQLLNWILDNCLLGFKFGCKEYVIGIDFLDDLIILAVNFGFWVIFAFFLCFSIKVFRWCFRKCLRK